MSTNPEIKPLNVIIVDDESDACKNLQKILLEYVDPGIKILGIANNTTDAELLIIQHKPDVVFLDIEMVNENAFDFLNRLSPIIFEVIFVTAYDEYAIKAFKLNAIDYILKPISIDELAVSVKKAKERLVYKKITGEHNTDSSLYSEIKNHAKLNKIRLKDNSGFHIIDFKDILYIEAKGSYSNVCFMNENETEKYIITTTALNEYEEIFPTDYFLRIHSRAVAF